MGDTYDVFNGIKTVYFDAYGCVIIQLLRNEVLSKIRCRSKKQLPYKLDYMESLNIKLHNTGPGKGFNEDEGRRFFTKQWDPLLADLRKKMELE